MRKIKIENNEKAVGGRGRRLGENEKENDYENDGYSVSGAIVWL